MTRVLTYIFLIITSDLIASFPVNKDFRVKLKPRNRDEVRPKTFGSLFAKISQEFTPEAILQRDLLSKTIPAPAPELGSGCTNQIARVLFPANREEWEHVPPEPPESILRRVLLTTMGPVSSPAREQYQSNEVKDEIPKDFRYSVSNISEQTIDAPPPQIDEISSYINLPLVQQPHKGYKLLVAAAPPDIKIGKKEDAENIVIYVIFPENSDIDGDKSEDLPQVYFLHKLRSTTPNAINKKPDDEIIVSNNRTVTGYRSKQVQKYLKFKNKLVNRYDYSLVP